VLKPEIIYHLDQPKDFNTLIFLPSFIVFVESIFIELIMKGSARQPAKHLIARHKSIHCLEVSDNYYML